MSALPLLAGDFGSSIGYCSCADTVAVRAATIAAPAAADAFMKFLRFISFDMESPFVMCNGLSTAHASRAARDGARRSRQA